MAESPRRLPQMPSRANAHETLCAILGDAELQRTIALHRVFVKVAGGIVPGAFLAQCWYWSIKTTNPDGWFYKRQIDWTEEIGATRREQESSRARLRDLGILEEEQRDGYNRVVSYRVNKERLLELVGDALLLQNKGAFP